MTDGSEERIKVPAKSNKRISILEKLKSAPNMTLKVRRKSQVWALTARPQQKRKIFLAKRVVNDGKTARSPLPGSLEYDFLKGKSEFLKKDHKQIHEKASKGQNLQPAPLKVMKNKDGFYIRRTLVGTPEQYQAAAKFHNTISKYTFNRKHISLKGELHYEEMMRQEMSAVESQGDSSPQSLMNRLRKPKQFSSVKDLSTTNIT